MVYQGRPSGRPWCNWPMARHSGSTEQGVNEEARKKCWDVFMSSVWL